MTFTILNFKTGQTFQTNKDLIDNISFKNKFGLLIAIIECMQIIIHDMIHIILLHESNLLNS